MAKDVVLTWTTENKVVPNAASAHHYVCGIGVLEANEPLDVKTHTFSVEPGTYDAHVSCVDENGTELSPPIFKRGIVVPEDATAPIPVNLDAT
jgi:hypothetical protein